MPHCIVRLLRVYASIVVLLVSGVLAFGVEPVRDGVDLDSGKLAAIAEAMQQVQVDPDVLRLSLPSLEKLIEVQAAATGSIAALDGTTLAASAVSARRDEFAAGFCNKAVLSVRHES